MVVRQLAVSQASPTTKEDADEVLGDPANDGVIEEVDELCQR